jgi:hypothetical protein
MVKFIEILEEFVMAFHGKKVADKECMCACTGIQHKVTNCDWSGIHSAVRYYVLSTQKCVNIINTDRWGTL